MPRGSLVSERVGGEILRGEKAMMANSRATGPLIRSYIGLSDIIMSEAQVKEMRKERNPSCQNSEAQSTTVSTEQN